MSNTGGLDGIRGAALDRIERSERQYKAAFFVAAVVEAMFLLGFLLLADLSNRTHLLLLIATIAVYTIVGLGLAALGSYINRSTLRILTAIELSGSQASESRR